MTSTQADQQRADEVAGAAAARLIGPERAPVFELDTSWPKPLPNNWALGIVWGVAVDSRDHVWAVHQVGWSMSSYLDEIKSAGKEPAPAVLEFDPEGNLLNAWGTPGQGGWEQGRDRPFFPAQSIFVDGQDNIWVSEEMFGHAVVKFAPDGTFLLQIGELEQTNGSADTALLGAPAGIDFDPGANEVYIADGYVNQRVIVFDSDTGAYKRHWGRYGLAPNDNFEVAPQPLWTPSPFLVNQEPAMGQWPRFAHGVNVSRDGLIYASDRSHGILYVHRPDGTYIGEASLPGPFNSVAFSPDAEQRYLYATGMNATARIYVLRRSDLQILGSFRSEGQHHMDTDSKGNLFTCGIRMPQRFALKDLPSH